MEKKSCKNTVIAEISLNIESIEFQEMTKEQRSNYYRTYNLTSKAYILPFTIVADNTGKTYKGEFVKYANTSEHSTFGNTLPHSKFLLCTMFNVNSLKIESNDKIECMYKYKRSGKKWDNIEINDKIEDEEAECVYIHRYDDDECMLDAAQT